MTVTTIEIIGIIVGAIALIMAIINMSITLVVKHTVTTLIQKLKACNSKNNSNGNNNKNSSSNNHYVHKSPYGYIGGYTGDLVNPPVPVTIIMHVSRKLLNEQYITGPSLEMAFIINNCLTSLDDNYYYLHSIIDCAKFIETNDTGDILLQPCYQIQIHGVSSMDKVLIDSNMIVRAISKQLTCFDAHIGNFMPVIVSDADADADVES